MRAPLAHARWTASAVLLLALAACGPTHDADLFRIGGTLGGSGGNAESGSAGTNGEAAGSGAGGNIQNAAGSAPSDAAGSGGASGSPSNGGAATASGAGAPAGGAISGGAGGAPAQAGAGGGSLTDCAEYGSDATYLSTTQHCYLVVHDLVTFAAAQAHCTTLGAHLVTLANEPEDSFAWSLSPEEHWIDSNDGRGPKESEPGTYTWLTGEPFTYTNWSSGQPNASQTECGASNGGGICYEHCAFQWTGGEHDGQWNDRFCLHTISSICEWDTGHLKP